MLRNCKDGERASWKESEIGKWTGNRTNGKWEMGTVSFVYKLGRIGEVMNAQEM